MRKPLTMEDYLNSRYIVEPFHLYDCCLVSNGGIAVILTSAERARSLKQPPVYVLGMGQAAPGDNQRTDREPGIYTGAKQSGEKALRMAGIHLSDIDICELYDCYTYTVLVTLEDYGFCQKGEGGAFVADGKLGPSGSVPTNIGGGSSRPTTCGALRHSQRQSYRHVDKGETGRSRRTISSWPVATAACSTIIRQRL
jgi:acetyl-CoA acetyltransferase